VDRAELIASRAGGGGGGETEARLLSDWRSRFVHLLETENQSSDELRTALGLSLSSQPQSVQFGSVTHNGPGDVNQAGRDINITTGVRGTIQPGPPPSDGRA
jgi:hypothetical protein